MDKQRSAAIVVCANAALLVGMSLYFILVPAFTVVRDLRDAHVREPGVPRAAVRLFRVLTPKYRRWAEDRLASERAASLSTRDISGTEWPLFGSVFYLWSVESLQEAWERDGGFMDVPPEEYARKAVEAATRLVIDPRHASWVEQHWGGDYLHEENVFYRMLVIAALTSHAKLTGSGEHLDTLRDQVEGLSSELNASPHGLLDDYPDQCYPGDVLTAVACIRRADDVLGTDHAEFARRALRGFEGRALDERGLVPYAADSRTGQALGPSRGCGNSYVCLFAPELWPARAEAWYTLYEEHFWQEAGGVAGFREFPEGMAGYDWYMDVDAGPVVGGFGVAGSAFGVGAARVNGRFDHAYPLTAEMLLASWPLPDGTLAVPRALSNSTDAPYLGEAAILFNLTRMPADNVAVTTGGSIPPIVYIVLLLATGAALATMGLAALRVRRFLRKQNELRMPRPWLQRTLWGVLVASAALCLLLGQLVWGVLLLLGAQFLPRLRSSGTAEAALYPRRPRSGLQVGR
ncbi:MAG: hypothetical protein R6X33_11900 [Candidatus Brocadiia bacterium]